MNESIAHIKCGTCGKEFQVLKVIAVYEDTGEEVFDWDESATAEEYEKHECN